jgi:hypothetical protein
MKPVLIYRSIYNLSRAALWTAVSSPVPPCSLKVAIITTNAVTSEPDSSTLLMPKPPLGTVLSRFNPPVSLRSVWCYPFFSVFWLDVLQEVSPTKFCSRSLCARSRIVPEKLIVAQIINSPSFMKPEGSLPCSQKTVSGPCFEPDKPSPTLTTYIIKIYVNIALLPTPKPLSCCLLLRCSGKNCGGVFYFCSACYMLRRSHSQFEHPNNIWWSVS